MKRLHVDITAITGGDLSHQPVSADMNKQAFRLFQFPVFEPSQLTPSGTKYTIPIADQTLNFWVVDGVAIDNQNI